MQIDHVLIVSLLVVLFIVFYFVYKQKENKHVMLDENIDSRIEENTELLNLMNQAKSKAKEKIQTERFNTTLTSPLSEDEANQYLVQLNFLSAWIQNNTGDKGIMRELNQLIQRANSERIADKTILLNILSNMYAMSYMEMLHRQNAEAYKVYSKYENPRNNKYYTQYLSS